MLEIYNYKENNTIMCNEREFTRNSYSIAVSNTKLGNKCRKIAEIVDGVSFVSNKDLKLNSTGETISWIDLSTGCKTLINILINPDKPVFIGECEKYIITMIYKLNSGKIYSPYKIVDHTEDHNNTRYKCINKNSETEVVGIESVYNWYDMQVKYDSTLIYNRITGRVFGIVLDIKLEHNITVLLNNTNKNFTLGMILSQFGGEYDIRIFDYKDSAGFAYKRFKDFIKNNQWSLIVIENIDILLDNEIKRVINKDKCNQYLLIGKHLNGLDIRPENIKEIHFNSNKLTFIDYF